MAAHNLIIGNVDQVLDTALNELSICYQHNEFSGEEKESLKELLRDYRMTISIKLTNFVHVQNQSSKLCVSSKDLNIDNIEGG